YTLTIISPRYIHSFPTRRSSDLRRRAGLGLPPPVGVWRRRDRPERSDGRAELEGGARVGPVDDGVLEGGVRRGRARVGRHQQQPDRKSTRLNSSHGSNSYAVFCL